MVSATSLIGRERYLVPKPKIITHSEFDFKTGYEGDSMRWPMAHLIKSLSKLYGLCQLKKNPVIGIKFREHISRNNFKERGSFQLDM